MKSTTFHRNYILNTYTQTAHTSYYTQDREDA